MVLCKFLTICPDATSTSSANEMDVATVIHLLEMGHRRARGIICFSKEWLELLSRKKVDDTCRTDHSLETCVEQDLSAATKRQSCMEAFLLTREEITSLYYCGGYVYDAYRIFIQES